MNPKKAVFDLAPTTLERKKFFYVNLRTEEIEDLDARRGVSLAAKWTWLRLKGVLLKSEQPGILCENGQPMTMEALALTLRRRQSSAKVLGDAEGHAKTWTWFVGFVEHERPATKAAQPKSAVDHGGPKLDAEMVAKQYEEAIKNLPPTRRYDVDDAKQDKKCEAEYRQIFWTHIPGNYDLDKLTSYAFHNDWYEVCDTGAGGLCRFAGVNRIDENGKLRKTGSPAQPKKAAPLPKMPDGYLSDEWLDACDEWGIDIDRAYAQYVEESRKLKFVMTPDGLAIRLNAALKKAQAEAEEHGFGNK